MWIGSYKNTVYRNSVSYRVKASLNFRKQFIFLSPAFWVFQHKVMILICHTNGYLKRWFFCQIKNDSFFVLSLSKQAFYNFPSKRQLMDLNSCAINLNRFYHHLVAWLTITIFQCKNYQKKMIWDQPQKYPEGHVLGWFYLGLEYWTIMDHDSWSYNYRFRIR